MRKLSRDEFLKLNRGMALHHIIETAQSVDRQWPCSEGLGYLLELLSWCQTHPQEEVQKLASRTHVWQKSDMSYEHFLGVLVPLERDYARAVVDHDFIPSTSDNFNIQKVKRWPLHLICDNIRSAFNVGSMLRSADCIGLESAHLCGYTASPNNSKTKKAAMGADEWVNWQWHAHTRDAIQQLKDKGICVVALETIPNTPSIYQFSWPKPAAILLGNERHGLAPDLLQEADQICHIPVYGFKNSLNIATAFALTAAEVVRQWNQEEGQPA